MDDIRVVTTAGAEAILSAQALEKLRAGLRGELIVAGSTAEGRKVLATPMASALAVSDTLLM